MKWEILDDGKALELDIQSISGKLIIPLKSIPPGMSIDDFIKFVESKGIILKID